jgi:hypothetical protein
MIGNEDFYAIPRANLGDLWVYISRVHFSIRKQGKAAALQNHGATGTFVDGVCINDSEWHYLEEGSTISTLPETTSKSTQFHQRFVNRERSD